MTKPNGQLRYLLYNSRNFFSSRPNYMTHLFDLMTLTWDIFQNVLLSILSSISIGHIHLMSLYSSNIFQCCLNISLQNAFTTDLLIFIFYSFKTAQDFFQSFYKILLVTHVLAARPKRLSCILITSSRSILPRTRYKIFKNSVKAELPMGH